MYEFGRICEAGSSIIRTDGSLSATALPGVLLGSLEWQNVADAARWPSNFSEQGLYFSRREGNPTAVAIPGTMLGNLVWQSSSSISEHASSPYYTSLIIGALGVLSVYLPDISKPFADYVVALEHVHMYCRDLMTNGAKYLVDAGVTACMALSRGRFDTHVLEREQ